MILLDTSGLLAAIDQSQRHHAACRVALERAQPPLILSPFVLAEIDYLLSARVGVDAELALLGEVARGAYSLVSFDAEQVAQAQAVVARYRSLEIGLADASLVVLAASLKTRDVLTLDERHFRALRTREGKKFRLWPADLNH